MQSGAQYYLAKDNGQKTYTLSMRNSGSQDVISATYGDTLTLSTAETVVDTGVTTTLGNTDSYNIVYTYSLNSAAGAATTASFTPSTTGTYVLTSGKDMDKNGTMDEILASTLLTVGKRNITIRPDWEGMASGTPVNNLSDISVKAADTTPLANADSTTDLSDIFTVVCGLYDAATGAMNAQTGAFSVSLNYKTGDDVTAFREKYNVTMESEQILRPTGTQSVSYSMEENGTSIEGRYGDNGIVFTSGDAIQVGQKLQFITVPQTGFVVDKWTVNGTQLDPASLPTGYTLNSTHNTLTIAALNDAPMTVHVSFRSDNYKVTYSVSGGHGDLNADATAASIVTAISSGDGVADGASVTFKATPADGYVVSGWTVNSAAYNWPDTNSAYRENTLKITDIHANLTVTVTYAQAGAHTVSASIEPETAGLDTAGVTVSAKDKATDAAISDLTAVRDGQAITFTVSTGANIGVKEWRISKDNGVTYTTIAGSGGRGSVTVYNITGDWSVKAIVTAAQSFTLTYGVVLDGSTVTDSAIASLSAKTNGSSLASSPATCIAYIPVDFALTLSDDYQVVSWSGAAVDANSNLKASIDSLSVNTTVTVTIERKPVTTTFTASTGGSITSILVGNSPIVSGAALEPGTIVSVTAAPNTGYEFQHWTVNNVVQTGESALTFLYTSDANGAAVKAVFQPIPYAVDWAASANGSVALDEHSGASGSIRGGTALSFSASPDSGYHVTDWTVNGVSQGSTGATFSWNVPLGAESGTTYAVRTVLEAGGYTVNYVQPTHGALTATVATGAQVTAGTQVLFTAAPDAGYEVAKWTVNGVDAQSTSTTRTVNITGDTTVSVTLVPSRYEVTYAANHDAYGTVVSTDGASPITVNRNGSVTLTATPTQYYNITGWTVGSTTYVADNADDGIDVSADLTSLTVSGIAADTSITANFAQQVKYIVSFSANGSGTDNVTAMTAAAISSGDQVCAGTPITFTAVPDAGRMVAHWYINGTLVTADAEATYGDNGLTAITQDSPIDNTLTVNALLEPITVTVDFANYAEYAIPQTSVSGSYTITDVTRTPAVPAADSGMIREGGTVQFTVTAANLTSGENGYLSKLLIDGHNCLTGGRSGTENVIAVTANADGSYTITVSNVTKDIAAEIVANKLVVEDTITVPASVPTITGYDGMTSEEKTAAVETLLTQSISSSTKTNTMEIALKTWDSGTGAWVNATEEAITDLGGVDVFLTYSDIASGADAADSFVVTHLILTGSSAGTVETFSSSYASGSAYYITRGTDGISFHVNSLSPFGVGYTNYVAPSKNDGGGGGGASAGLTLTFDVNGGSEIAPITDVRNAIINLKAYTPTRSGYTFTGWYSDKELTVAVTSITLTASTTVYAGWRVALPFTDIADGAYYDDAVIWAIENGVTNGTTATTFAPGTGCTRAQAVTFLWRANGSPTPRSLACPFVDVDADAYYYTAVLWAIEEGITIGTTATTFTPDATCTRAQIVTFLYRAQV